MNKSYAYMHDNYYEVTNTEGIREKREGVLDMEGMLEVENHLEVVEYFIDEEEANLESYDKKIKKTNRGMLILLAVYLMLIYYMFMGLGSLAASTISSGLAKLYANLFLCVSLPIYGTANIALLVIKGSIKRNIKGVNKVLAKLKSLKKSYTKEISDLKNSHYLEISRFLKEEERKEKHTVVKLKSEDEIADELVPILQDIYDDATRSPLALARKRKKVS